MARSTPATQVLDTAPGFFGDIFVIGRGTRRAMRFAAADGVDQSAVDLDRPERPVPAYLRAAALGLTLAGRRRRALVVGLGGGGFIRFLRRRYPRLVIDVVELDPNVVMLARRHFRFREGRHIVLHETDAILHLSETREEYDFILLDAYDGPTLAPRLASRDFFALSRARLAAGGICVANVSMRSRREEGKIARNFERAFAPRSFELYMPRDWNRLFFGGDQPLPDEPALRRHSRQLDGKRHLAFPLMPFLRNYRRLR
ncbi:MAG: fused MFS/spermidine synthase [Deltaproteobacteria bacterium]